MPRELDAKKFHAYATAHMRQHFTMEKLKFPPFSHNYRFTGGPGGVFDMTARDGIFNEAQIAELFERLGRPPNMPGAGSIPVTIENAMRVFDAAGLRQGNDDAGNRTINDVGGRVVFTIPHGVQTIETNIVGSVVARGLACSKLEGQEVGELVARFKEGVKLIPTGGALNAEQLIGDHLAFQGVDGANMRSAAHLSDAQFNEFIDDRVEERGKNDFAFRSDFRFTENVPLTRVYNVFSESGHLTLSVFGSNRGPLVSFAGVAQINSMLVEKSGGLQLSESFRKAVFKEVPESARPILEQTGVERPPEL